MRVQWVGSILPSPTSRETLKEWVKNWNFGLPGEGRKWVNFAQSTFKVPQITLSWTDSFWTERVEWNAQSNSPALPPKRAQVVLSHAWMISMCRTWRWCAVCHSFTETINSHYLQECTGFEWTCSLSSRLRSERRGARILIMPRVLIYD